MPVSQIPRRPGSPDPDARHAAMTLAHAGQRCAAGLEVVDVVHGIPLPWMHRWVSPAAAPDTISTSREEGLDHDRYQH